MRILGGAKYPHTHTDQREVSADAYQSASVSVKILSIHVADGPKSELYAMPAKRPRRASLTQAKLLQDLHDDYQADTIEVVVLVGTKDVLIRVKRNRGKTAPSRSRSS